MRMVALGEISEINPSGPTPGQIKPDDKLDFVPMAAVGENGRMAISDQRAYSDVAKGFTAFRNGDVLLAKITPCFENNKIAVANITTAYAFGSTEFHVIRCSVKELHPNYLAHFLRQDRVRYAGERRMTGSAGQRRVPKAFLKELTIPLPPLSEQKRITAILDQADTLRRLRQRAMERLDELSQAIFYETFGDPKTNPKKLPSQSLGELINVSSGEGLTGADQNGGPYPVYGGNGINGWHDAHLVAAGTIVIGRVGVYCGVVHVTDREAWVTDNALIVKKKKQGLDTTYLAAALRCANLNQYAGRSAQPLVSGSRIYPVRVLVPPSEIQRQFQLRMAERSRYLQTLSAYRSALDCLFFSLQHYAFRGDL